MALKFNKGDKIRFIVDRFGLTGGWICWDYLGEEGIILDWFADYTYTVQFKNEKFISGLRYYESLMEKVEDNFLNSGIATKSMNIKEKFLTSLKKEPEKSFRKAEITNGDDMLTEDGNAIFLTWLLQKHGADFKKEVVDEMLELKKEEEK